MTTVDHRQEAIEFLEHYLDIACKMTCDRDEMAAIVDHIIAAAVEEVVFQLPGHIDTHVSKIKPQTVGRDYTLKWEGTCTEISLALRSKNEALDQEAVTLRDEATTLRATILHLREVNEAMVNRIKYLDRELALNIAPRREITSPDPTNTEESR